MWNLVCTCLLLLIPMSSIGMKLQVVGDAVREKRDREFFQPAQWGEDSGSTEESSLKSYKKVKEDGFQHSLVEPMLFPFFINEEERFVKFIGVASLFTAIVAEDFEQLKRLVEDGANITEVDHQGFTPLHVAVMKGYRDIVTYLLEKGADVTALSVRGDMAIHGNCPRS